MSSPLDIVADLSALLDELNIPYVLGGSVASSLIGEPRTTVDVDFAVRLQLTDLDRLAVRLADTYDLPTLAARNAVEHAGSFNLLHTTAAMKVDLFVLGDGLLDRNQIDRRIDVTIRTHPPTRTWITSPERSSAPQARLVPPRRRDLRPAVARHHRHPPSATRPTR
ncbi:MAG: hypothetical protein AB7O92_08395 [Acidimicrobiia bacterium]